MSIRLDSINSFEFTGVSSNGVTYLICAEKNGEKLWFFKGLFFFIEATNKLFLLKYYHYPEIYGSISGDITYFFENIHLKGLGNIDGIYSLDKNFNVCRKLQFIENRMAFSSSFFYNEQNKLTEYVYFPTELYEKDVTKLNEITLNSLEVALSEKGQRYTFVFKIEGNPDYHDFVWNYFYDFRPFMLD